MCRISLFKVLDDSQGMEVVIEPQPISLQATIQRTLPCVSERRMPNIMHQRQCLGKIDIEAERRTHLPRDLGNLNRVRQPTAEMIRRAACKYLRFPGQPPKCTRLNDAISVPLEWRSSVTRGGRKSTDGKTLLLGTKDAATMKIEGH